MNATVTRSATKSTTVKGVSKTTAKTVEPAKGKTAVKPATKSILKAVAGKVAKTVANALKPAAKTASSSIKAIAKQGKTTVKSSVKPAVKPGTKSAGTAKIVPAATRAAAAKVSTPKTAKGATASKKTSSQSSKETSGATMSSSNAGAGLTDKMEKPVVSKVSEVATKTTKPTAAPAEGRLLTEEEILKMSDKDYMNEAQLAFFKARLQQLERDLLKNAGETTEHLRETVLVPDPADRATIEEEHALELRTRDRERKLLKKVQQAIVSIDAGEYGWCEETGEPIGIPRLLARPTATLSLEAQQRRELKQKLYGD
jgi:DnaK suppressor protein